MSMKRNTWLKKIARQITSPSSTDGWTPANYAPRPVRTAGLKVESLEDRTVPAVIVFQEGQPITLDAVSTGVNYAGTADTHINQTSGSDNTNFGSATSIVVDSLSPIAHAAMVFNGIFGGGVGQIPVGSTINSATLNVNVTNTGENPTMGRLLGPWGEDTVTWNTFTLNGNVTAGIQFDGVEGVSLRTLSGFNATGLKTITVTPEVTLWGSGTPNYGWGFLPGGPNGVNWDSSENASLTTRPKLTIDYTPPASNNPPTITSNGGGSTATITRAQGSTYVTTVAATDTDNGQSVTYSISGPDAAAFTINAASGLLTFTGSPTGPSTLLVTVTATDNGAPAATDTQDLTVNVVVDNGAPTITNDSSNTTSNISVAEGVTLAADIDATDPETNTITYSIVGGLDAARFTIDSSTGVLNFVSPPNFESPQDSDFNNIYQVIVLADDGINGNDVQTLNIQITDVAEFDFGDAPESYGTSTAYHIPANTGPKLGTLRDDEPSPRSPLDGTGDDSVGADDEDGVVFTAQSSGIGNFAPGTTGQVIVTVTGSGFLDAWIDFNANGVFDDPTEAIADNLAVSGGDTILSFAVPVNAVVGTTYSRFRVSSAGNLTPTISAADGEVEDYLFKIGQLTGGPITLVFGDGINNYLGTLDTNIVDADDIDRGASGSISVDTSVNGATGNDEQALLQFSNLFGTGKYQIPNGSTISSANLRLLQYDGAGGAGSVGLHRMLAPWTEASTWNSLVGGVSRDNIEALTTPTATMSPGSANNVVPVNMTVTADVSAWASGSNNYGWLLDPTALTSTSSVNSYSSEAALNVRPRLTITFVAPQPVVASLSPASGDEAGGTTVTITGSNFTEDTSVLFGSTAAAVTFVSATELTAVSPAGTGTADVVVTTTGGPSANTAADDFTYASESSPTIATLAPSAGTVTGGTTVTITGTGFTGATLVMFGGNAASFVVDSDTQITATTPAGSGVVDVSVTTPSGTSANTAADDYTYITKLTNVVIGDGTGQRSTIRSITLTFDGNIDLGGVGLGSIAITNQSNVVIPGLNINVAGAGTNTLVLTFSDTNPNDNINNFDSPLYGTPASTGPVTYGSLVDGLYRLKLDGASLLSGGVAVDIDANGTAGGTRSDDFHRLFGDKDGDQTVGTFDYFPSLINAINKELGEPGFNSAWDYDNDDVIGTFDFFPHLVNRFNAEIF